MIEALEQWAVERGYRAGWGSLSALDEVRSDLERRLEAGEIDPEFHRDQLASLQYSASQELSDAKRVLLIAVPRPGHTVRFTLDAGPFDTLLPPTYVWYKGLPEEVRRDLDAQVFHQRFQLRVLSAPLKALASRLGLVVYGRNNITYVPGLGSYFQLVGFLTEAELDLPAGWPRQPARQMRECENCESCRSACPTGAIAEERFLLHAERCLTLFNEAAGEWPDWLSPSMHHCLIGCLACQRACPENAALLRTEPAGMCFSAQETEAILSDDGERRGPAWPGIKQKLATVRMNHFEPVLSRNLRALLPATAR